MTDTYLEGRLNVSLHMMDAATDVSARLAHMGLAKAYTARIKARAIVRALQLARGAVHD